MSASGNGPSQTASPSRVGSGGSARSTLETPPRHRPAPWRSGQPSPIHLSHTGPTARPSSYRHHRTGELIAMPTTSSAGRRTTAGRPHGTPHGDEVQGFQRSV